MNFHDSERMAGVLKREGYSTVDDPRKADLILFNTCSIREKAEQKFLSQLGQARRLKHKNPHLKIAVTGCVAQQKGAEIKDKVPYVDYVLGPQNISRVGEALKSDDGIYLDENPSLVTEDIPAERKDNIRAWINIMYGCNNFCSYCVVPYTRGRERSRPVDSILGEIRGLVAAGYIEVTLLGQNVNSYRGEVSFPELLRLINEIDGLERIRFVTSHPKDMGDDLIDSIKHLDKVCEHIHLPLQSGSDRVLGLMNRKYTFAEYMEKVQKLRTAIPDIAITTDIIAGFPTETEDDHRMTVAALKEIEFDGIYAFKFSPRSLTKAERMEGHLKEAIKSERLSEILMVQDGITEQKNRAAEGSVQEVLVEGRSANDPDRLTGRTRTNKIVNFPYRDYITPGMMVKVEIVKGNRHSLEGIAVDI